MTMVEKIKSARAGLLARIKASGSRVPVNHMLYKRLIPVSIVLMSILMGGLILFAAAVLLGLIPFS
jgi:hypothetical protein